MKPDKLSGMAGVSSSSEEDYDVKGYHYRHEVVAAANAAGMAMLFTGVRHFQH